MSGTQIIVVIAMHYFIMLVQFPLHHTSPIHFSYSTSAITYRTVHCSCIGRFEQLVYIVVRNVVEDGGGGGGGGEGGVKVIDTNLITER